MLNDFRKHINTHLSFLEDKKLVLACSGGVDSMVLAHLCYQLNFNIAIAHCNFSLRGAESDGDLDFVKSWAEEKALPFFSKNFDTQIVAEKNKISIQMAARDLRYDWFHTILKEFDYQYLLTAHHADDSLETFLINLSRGTGLRGLTGILEQNNTVVRPLLPYSRDQIITYAKKNNLYWREDSSNTKTDYLRNKLRHDIIPTYKEVSKSTLKNFGKTQRYLRGSQTLVDDYIILIRNLIVAEIEGGYTIDIARLMDIQNHEVVLFELLSPFNFNAWEDIKGLLTAQTGKQIFSSTHRLLKNRSYLLLTEREEDEGAREYYIEKDTRSIEIPIQLNFTSVPYFKITNAHTFFVDTEKLHFPLQLRRWQEGDIFHPFGMKGKKKLSKFFKDEKLSLVAKSNTWVLCSDHKIVWVVGMRGDERFKVTKETQDIIQIDYIPI